MTQDELNGATRADDIGDAPADREPPFTAVIEKLRSALRARFAPRQAATAEDSVLPEGANLVAGSTAPDPPRRSCIDEHELGQSLEAHRVLAATTTAWAEKDDLLDAKMRARRLQLHERSGLDG